MVDMAFVKADLDKEKNELNKLVSEEESARKAYEEFQARIALQQQLVQMRKAEHMTQSDVAHAAGLSQQAVSRIEKGVIQGSLVAFWSQNFRRNKRIRGKRGIRAQYMV